MKGVLARLQGNSYRTNVSPNVWTLYFSLEEPRKGGLKQSVPGTWSVPFRFPKWIGQLDCKKGATFLHKSNPYNPRSYEIPIMVKKGTRAKNAASLCHVSVELLC